MLSNYKEEEEYDDDDYEDSHEALMKSQISKKSPSKSRIHKSIMGVSTKYD